mgnify:FL=1
MPNKEMRAAVEEFILQRINICGAHESPGLQTAREQFKLCIEKLNQTLSDQQNSLYRECENTYALVDGETMQCYYRAGFADAVVFLLGWRDGIWN